MRTQLSGETVRTVNAGDGWSEPPGSHHLLTENASQNMMATLFVVFVTPGGVPLKTDDTDGDSP